MTPDQRWAVCDFCLHRARPLTVMHEGGTAIPVEPIPADISITQELLDHGDPAVIVQDGPFVGLAGVNYELIDLCPAHPRTWHARRTS